jgi:hypothetical protein
MHRCGTSVVARALNLLGAHLGPKEDFMLPKPDNPTGFWETLTVAQIHDDLFAQLGGRWDRPPVLEPGWETKSDLEPFVERIRAVVASHFSAANVAVWKDPRGSLFLPLWRRVVPIERIVLCIRRPDEVAGSLAAREDIGSEHAAALWLRYIVAAWLDETEHILVTFDESHERPRELARHLADFVGGPPPSDGALAEIRRFVDPELRHYHPSPKEPGPVMELAQATYALIEAEPPDVVRPFLRALSNSWRAEARKDDGAAAFRSVFDELGPSVVDLSKGSGTTS